MLDPTTGEVIKRRLEHENGKAKKFYATLPSPGRVGMEATYDAQWIERVLREHHHELWIGDAAEIRAATVRKRRRTRAMLFIFSNCYSRTVFPESGYRPAGTRGCDDTAALNRT